MVDSPRSSFPPADSNPVQPHDDEPPHERVFVSSVCSIGALRCGASDPTFPRPGPIRRHVFVFPIVPVWVGRSDEALFLADPNIVTFHAQGDEIQRRAIDRRGDCCNWFALDENYLMPRLESHRATSPSTTSNADGLGPFGLRYGPSSRDAFLRQSILIDHLQKEPKPDELQVEEAVLDLADDVFHAVYQPGNGPTTRRTSSVTQARHRKLVEDIQSWLSEHFANPATLEDIADAVGSSPFHIHRIFRSYAGRTLHEYRNQLRLRTGLAAILDGEDNLTTLALSLGFASHSHFTDAFRRSFGLPPSKLRGDAWSRLQP